MPPRYVDNMRFKPGPNTKPGYRWCTCGIVCKAPLWASKSTYNRHRTLARQAGYIFSDNDDDEAEEPPRKRVREDEVELARDLVCISLPGFALPD